MRGVLRNERQPQGAPAAGMAVGGGLQGIQELAAMRGMGAVTYEVEGTGPDHNRSFTASCLLGGTVHGTGPGTSKKEAERRAAESAYSAITGTTRTDGHGRPLADGR